MATTKRLFIADDSRLVRMLLRRALESTDEVVVVGEAADGEAALDGIESTDPDVVILDVMMPKMSGLEVTARIMGTRPRPILIVSDLVGTDATLSFEALRLGALDVIRKPAAAELADPSAVSALIRKVRILSGVPVLTRHRRTQRQVSPRPITTSPPAERPGPAELTEPGRHWGPASLVCIGASTGGPPALLQVLAGLDGHAPWPILIVQHVASGFIAGMTRWLSEASRLEIEIATDGRALRPGTVFIAGDDRHLRLSGSALALEGQPPELLGRGRHCPSVDALFDSVATSSRASSTIAVLLTGMGRDGAEGMLRLRRAGAYTIAQDEATSTVYGMPKAAAELNAAHEVLPLHAIPARLRALSSQPRGRPPTGRT